MTDKNNENFVIELAKKSGIDNDVFAVSDRAIIEFFKAVVEECAKVAEKQARSYTGESNEHVGCGDAATAIRTFGKLTGNYEN